MNYDQKISEAIEIQKKYLSVGPLITRKISMSQNKHNPNSGANAMAKNFVYAGGKLAGQVIGVLERDKGAYLQLGVVGLRSLFEMSVNAIYIFNHPQIGQKKTHIRKVCKELIILANKKENVNHTRLDGKPFRQRLEEVNMGHQYNENYRIMSDWAHLMSQTIFLNDVRKAEKFGTDIAVNALHAVHNIFDSVSTYCDFNLDPDLEKSVREYEPLPFNEAL